MRTYAEILANEVIAPELKTLEWYFACEIA